MKVAVTSAGETLDSAVDARFGRAHTFIVYTQETGEYAVVPNTQNLNAPQGAGIQAAQLVAEQDVAAVITGNCGPKAFRTLSAAGIEVYSGVGTTVQEALRKHRDGDLPRAEQANVEGHW